MAGSDKNSSLGKMNVVVMAGGSGTRFWPESTEAMPKQYLKLGGDKTLLQKTLERFKTIIHPQNLSVVTLSSQKDSALLFSGGKLTEESLILEPMARNTAPCILLSLAHLLHRGADESDLVSFFAADHLIQDVAQFCHILSLSASFVEKHPYIVTLGIMPTFPHTGFGYIASGDILEGQFLKSKGFCEKPDLATAKNYLLQGNYYWNAGMFIASIRTLLEEFSIHAPTEFAYFQEMRKALEENNQENLTEIYRQIKSNSIDYALMEKSERVAVIKADMGWNDIGSWDALSEVLEKKEENYLAQNNQKYFFHNAKENIVFTNKEKMVVLIDVDQLVVIENEKSLVVMPKKSSQKVKDVVHFLKGQSYGKELI